jgi:bla regulator protein BlaR1
MTTVWIAYTMLLTVLLAAGALALERVATIWGLPRRFVWIVVMAAAAVAPAIVARRATSGPIAPAAGSVSQVGGGSSRGSARLIRRPAPTRWRILAFRLAAATRAFDRRARMTWALGSALVLIVFARALLVLRFRRATWSKVLLDGRSVWISPDTGPAVVGLVRPEIVVPRWALPLDSAARGLMLRHEMEHIEAGDPYALLFAGVMLVLMPWNLGFWWMVRRLRLAIEMDCDARVIRAVGGSHEYGMLLVAVGERRSSPLSLAASLVEQQPFLERRIAAMTTLRPRHPMLASLPFVAIALVATAVAAQTPVPATPPAGIIARAEGGRTQMDSMPSRVAANRELIQTLVTTYFPDVVRGSSDVNRIAFVLDGNDAYVTSAGVISPTTSGGSDTVRASAVRRAGATALDLSAFGLGTIDRSLIRGTASSSYRAGILSPHGLDVYIVRLKGTTQR